MSGDAARVVTRQEFLGLLDDIENELTRVGCGTGDDLALERKRLINILTSKPHKGPDTLLSLVERGENIVTEFFILDQNRAGVHSVEQFKQRGILTQNDSPTLLHLFKPVVYQMTFRCTRCALDHFCYESLENKLKHAKTPSDIENVVMELAQEHPNDLIPLGLKHVPGDKMRTGLGLVIDCLPAVVDIEEAREIVFMRELVSKAEEALDDPVGNELACSVLTATFLKIKKKHFNCKTCYPSAES